MRFLPSIITTLAGWLLLSAVIFAAMKFGWPVSVGIIASYILGGVVALLVTMPDR